MIPVVGSMTARDELEFSSLGTRKTALFVVIPDNDTSYNFLVSMLYTQLFQQLLLAADSRRAGSRFRSTF